MNTDITTQFCITRGNLLILLSFFKSFKFPFTNNSFFETFLSIFYIWITKINKEVEIGYAIHRYNFIHPNRRFVVTTKSFLSNASLANGTTVLLNNLITIHNSKNMF